MIVQTALGPVEVEVRGSGPALLGIHGLPGDWRQCRSIAADHAGVATVVLPSRPGYGRTPLSSGPTPDAQGDLWAALLTALDLDQAVVIGVSGGGPSSVSFAARHPDRCAGLLLCCAVAIGQLTVPPAMRVMAAVPGLWTLLGALHNRRADPVKIAAGLRAELTETELANLNEHDLQQFSEDAATWLSGRGLRNDVRSMSSATDRSPQVRSPTVVLHGAADTVVPVACAEHHAAMIPGALLEVLPDVGHGIPLSARAEFVRLTRGLLSPAAG